MKHNVQKYLEDIRLSILDIENDTEKITSAKQIEENQLLFDGLCRRFAIIGEPVYRADKIDKHLPITDKRKIMGLRHIIVHDYDLVRAADLWTIINKHLSVLKAEVEAILKQEE